MSDERRWRRCSACKKDIGFAAIYWVCNVSTCNRKRTGLAFCSVSCWEVHLPMVNHRESWALEQRAPASAQAAAAASSSGAGTKPRAPRSRAAAPARGESPTSQEILIVASRLKNYIREQSGFNTSDTALRPLSDFVRRACGEGIRNAARDERQTVMGRDIPGK
ncbi:MAG: hypothetical protein JRH19_26520 [Deltaproteobacteria bacterium]|nr:hypothetical protein [Deltaproteobacteria bacterium]